MVKNEDKRYRIEYFKNECIGAFACVAAEPEDWEEDESGVLADLREGKHLGDEKYVKYLDDLRNNLEAAQSCPVNCIHIYDQEKDERLI